MHKYIYVKAFLVLLLINLLISMSLLVSCGNREFDQSTDNVSNNISYQVTQETVTTIPPTTPIVTTGPFQAYWDLVNQIYDVALDKSGNFYTNGYGYLKKYDPSGVLLWELKTDINYGVIAVDDSGNLFLAGETGKWIDTQAPEIKYRKADAFLSKYDTSGKLIWTRQYGDKYIDTAKGIAIDKDGNPYIVGSIYKLFSPDRETGTNQAYVVKYDTQGTLIWQNIFGYHDPADRDINAEYLGDDQAFCVAVDDFLNVYVGGLTEGATPDKLSSAAFLCKYDSNGSKLWYQEFKKTVICELSAEVEGCLYAAGFDTGDITLGSTFGGTYYSFERKGQVLRKFDLQGKEIWIRQFENYLGQGGIDSSEVQRKNILDVDEKGCVYLICSQRTGTFLRKFDANSNEIWKYTFGLVEKEPHNIGWIALDNKGYVYLVGWGIIPISSPQSTYFVIKQQIK